MKTTVQDLLVTLFGAITSLLTAILLSWIERHWNFSIYSFMFWFVIPVGAIGAGFVAAGGYYLGAVFFNHRPQKIILLNMIAISLGTYFLIQYLDYIFLEIEGKQVSDVLSFWQYWDLTTAHTSVQFRVGRGHVAVGSPVELGSLGYVYALLQIIGFAIGGVFIYFYLAAKLFCGKCSRYFSNKGTTTRYTGDGEKFKEFFAKMAALLDEHKLSEAIALHATEGGEVKCKTKEHHLKTDVNIKYCKGCGQHYLGLDVMKWNGKDDWSKIDDLCVARLSDTELSLVK
jgi:hypothetical protein